MGKGKALRDVAYGLPSMFGGWRMADDFERLATIPDGTLRIDLVNGSVDHSLTVLSDLRIGRELSSWMKGRLAHYQVPLANLSSAKLDVQIKTDRVPTDKSKVVLFEMRIHSCLEFEGKKFERTVEKAVWHHRPLADPPVQVRIGRALISAREWVRFQWNERSFLSKVKSLKPGTSGSEIRSMLGPPTTASELNSGKDTWVYVRGTYWGLGSGKAFYGEKYLVQLDVHGDKFVDHRVLRYVL